MAITDPFPFTYKEAYDGMSSCVFKLRFGTKYFIFKCLKLRHTVEGLSKQIHRELSIPKDDSILFKVVAYVKRARVTMMEVEMIHDADNPVELLKVEYEQLQKAKKDPNCLNTRFVNNDYYPAWIPQTAINEFNKQLQGHVKTGKGEKIMEYIENKFH